jgi:HAD superfamily hydrolase (TIGR01509 family)
MIEDLLIIFDCDGVLVDSEILARQAMQAVFLAEGVRVSDSTLEACFGIKLADILAKVAKDTGRIATDSVREKLWPETRQLFAQHLKPVPGVAAFLEALPNKRCVASSSHKERIEFSLDKTGLAKFFGNKLYSSQQVLRGKPAPDLFLFAAAEMNADPAHCIVIEDSIFGVQGAVAAGMTAIGFLGGSHVGDIHGEALRKAGAKWVERDWAAVSRRLLG